MMRVVAVLAACLSMPVVAAPAGPKPFTALTTGMVMLAPENPGVVGTERTMRENDEIFRARLGWFASATIAAGVTAHIADADWAIPQTALLQRAIVFAGGDLADQPRGSIVYCDTPKAGLAKGLLNGITLGLSQLAARFAKETQLCVMDSDANGDFDRAFLVGLKKPEDRKTVTITPVGYTTASDRPVDGDSYVHVRYLDGGLLSGPSLAMDARVGGVAQGLAGITMRAGAAQSLPVFVPASQSVKLKKLPQSMRFGAAALTVTAVDPVAKTATVRLDSNFAWTPVRFRYPVQTIYIYY